VKQLRSNSTILGFKSVFQGCDAVQCCDRISTFWRTLLHHLHRRENLKSQFFIAVYTPTNKDMIWLVASRVRIKTFFLKHENEKINLSLSLINQNVMKIYP